MGSKTIEIYVRVSPLMQIGTHLFCDSDKVTKYWPNHVLGAS